MANASAKYILAAEDRTQSAVRSVRAGFESIDKSAKELTKGFAGLGKMIGAGGAVALAMKAFGTLGRNADLAITNLAKSNADFAETLARTKAAHENLWKAGAKTAEAQERLNAALSDPAIVGAAQRAADGVASSYISIKTGALEALAAVQEFDRWFNETSGLYDKASGLKQDYEALVASKMPGAIAAQQQKDAAGGPNPYMKLVNDAFAREAREAAEEEKALMKQRVEAWDDAHQAYFETMRNMTEFESALQMSIAKTGSVLTDELDTFADFGIAKIGDALGTVDTQFKEMSVYADQAARNMQSAFADFLFDPFEGGVKGMLKSFIDAIRRMMAEKAAAAIFDSVSNGGLGLGGLIGSLFGFAKGGSFEVGGSGGTDS